MMMMMTTRVTLSLLAAVLLLQAPTTAQTTAPTTTEVYGCAVHEDDRIECPDMSQYDDPEAACIDYGCCYNTDFTNPIFYCFRPVYPSTGEVLMRTGWPMKKLSRNAIEEAACIVEPDRRLACGGDVSQYDDPEETCMLRRGCCYDATIAGAKLCFLPGTHSSTFPPTTEPTTAPTTAPTTTTAIQEEAGEKVVDSCAVDPADRISCGSLRKYDDREEACRYIFGCCYSRAIRDAVACFRPATIESGPPPDMMMTPVPKPKPKPVTPKRKPVPATTESSAGSVSSKPKAEQAEGPLTLLLALRGG